MSVISIWSLREFDYLVRLKVKINYIFRVRHGYRLRV